MSKTTKTEYATLAAAKGAATKKTKTRGIEHVAHLVGDVYKVLPAIEVAALIQAAQDADAAEVGQKKEVIRDGGFLTQATRFLRKQGVQAADELTVEKVIGRKGMAKFWIKTGDTRLSWFPSEDRAALVIAAV